MKRTIITLFAILALALAGGLLAQSSTTGTAPAGTALSDPGQQSNNLNKPENVNPSPANTNGMTTGSKPYTQPTGTTPTTTPSADQPTTGSTATTTTTTTTTEPTTGTPSSYGTTGTTDTGSTTGMSHHKSGRLPRTGSDLPLLAAFGALALSAGFVVRKRRDA
jgi:LPXTG-motif cell wall-anchored protein